MTHRPPYLDPAALPECPDCRGTGQVAGVDETGRIWQTCLCVPTAAAIAAQTQGVKDMYEHLQAQLADFRQQMLDKGYFNVSVVLHIDAVSRPNCTISGYTKAHYSGDLVRIDVYKDRVEEVLDECVRQLSAFPNRKAQLEQLYRQRVANLIEEGQKLDCVLIEPEVREAVVRLLQSALKKLTDNILTDARG